MVTLPQNCTFEIKMVKDFELEKLNGHENYHTWAFVIKNLMDYKGYGNCLKLIVEKDVSICAEKNATKLTACKALVVLSVEKNLYTHITKCETALDIWNKLASLYEDVGISRKITILRKMLSCKLENADDMQSYIDESIDGATKLSGIGFDISDEWIGPILLAGLTENFRPLIMAIEATTSEIKSDIIISKLMDAQTGSTKGKGFFSKKGKKGTQKSNNVKCKNCGRSNHQTKDCRDSKKCYNCGKPNHLSKDCKNPKKDSNGDKGQGSSSSANAAFSAMSF